MQINGVFPIQRSWQQHSMSPRIFVCFLMIFEKLMLFLHCWYLTIIACISLGKLTQLCNSLALTCFLWFVYFNSSIFLLLGWTSCLCFLVHDSDLLFMHRKLWHWPHRCRLLCSILELWFWSPLSSCLHTPVLLSDHLTVTGSTSCDSILTTYLLCIGLTLPIYFGQSFM